MMSVCFGLMIRRCSKLRSDWKRSVFVSASYAAPIFSKEEASVTSSILSSSEIVIAEETAAVSLSLAATSVFVFALAGAGAAIITTSTAHNAGSVFFIVLYMVIDDHLSFPNKKTTVYSKRTRIEFAWAVSCSHSAKVSISLWIGSSASLE